ncbi:MAG: hypothetical protein ACLP2H_06685 [Terriglobales bacterium]
MSDDSNNLYLSGILLEFPPRSIHRSDLEQVHGLSFAETVGTTPWERYSLQSRNPLRHEDVLRPGPYHYPVICRRSGSRLLLLSISRQVVDHIVQDDFERIFSPRLRRVSIAVDDLVKAMTQRPTSYALSFAHARVPAFGNSLRAVSFYGDDLAEASLFRDQLDLLVFFTCGLREAIGGPEIVRLGSDGGVSFFMNETGKVLEVERALAFLREEGYFATEPLGGPKQIKHS